MSKVKIPKIIERGEVLEVYSPWAPGFPDEFKRVIPGRDRRPVFHDKKPGAARAKFSHWEVNVDYLHEVKQVLKVYFSMYDLENGTDRVWAEHQHDKKTEPVSRVLVDVWYIGRAKERDDGTETAWGMDSNEDWSFKFTREVLEKWFDGKYSEVLDYFEILDVSRKADDRAIKKAYRIQSRTWHPDVSDDPDAHDRFIAIKEAYDALKDGKKRKRYLAALKLEEKTDFNSKAAHLSGRKDKLENQYGWRSPKVNGRLIVSGHKSQVFNRDVITVTEIHEWDNVTNEQGKTLVSRYTNKVFEIEWL